MVKLSVKMIESKYSEQAHRIAVHTPEILEEIVADTASYDSVNSKSDSKDWHRRSASAPVSRPHQQHLSFNDFPVRTSTSSTTPFQAFRLQTWLNDDAVKDMQERSNLESRSVRNLYRTVLHNEETLLDQLNKFLEYVDVANENRKAELFKRWSERVYTPLQEKIKSEMNSSNFKMFDRKKRQLYNQYIDYSNRKGAVFLDVFSPEEYDPMELLHTRPGPLTARIKNLDENDPLLHQDIKRILEEQDTMRCKTGQTTRAKDIRNYHLPPQPLVPLGRHNTTCRTWQRMSIHNIDSPPRLMSRQRMNNTCGNSQIEFVPCTISSPDLVDTELKCQKKRLYPEKYSRRRVLEWPETKQTENNVASSL